MSEPEVPGDDDHIKIPRNEYVQLLSEMWDDNQKVHEKVRELERRNQILEKWTRGMGHTAELIDLADVIAEIAGNNPPDDPRLAKAFEIARRFTVENPKHKR